MKILNTLICGAIVAVSGAGTAIAAERVVVYPTGQFPADVENVQSAIDSLHAAGVDGVLVLKAIDAGGTPTPFNFGDDPDPMNRGSIIIGGDPSGSISIRGTKDDDDDDNGPWTTIYGGFVPITMQRRDDFEVRNVRFDGAFQHAILVQSATNTIIKNNQILDTVGYPDFFRDPNDPSQGIFPLTRAIYLEGLGFNADEITGKILIKANLIDTATAAFTDGITTFFTNAKTTVGNNTIRGINVGIRQDAFLQSFDAVENEISAFVPAPFFFSGGITASCGNGEDAQVRIKDNEVAVADDAGGQAAAIALVGDDFFSPACTITNAEIKGNEIQLTNAFSGISVGAFGFAGGNVSFTGNSIKDNEIAGTTLFGIEVFAFIDSTLPMPTTVMISGDAVSVTKKKGLESTGA